MSNWNYRSGNFYFPLNYLQCASNKIKLGRAVAYKKNHNIWHNGDAENAILNTYSKTVSTSFSACKGPIGIYIKSYLVLQSCLVFSSPCCKKTHNGSLHSAKVAGAVLLYVFKLVFPASHLQLIYHSQYSYLGENDFLLKHQTSNKSFKVSTLFPIENIQSYWGIVLHTFSKMILVKEELIVKNGGKTQIR